MAVTRRGLLGAGLAGLAVIGIGGLSLPTLRARVRETIVAWLGREIADSDAGQTFIEDYATFAILRAAERGGTRGAIARRSDALFGAGAGAFVINNVYRIANLDADAEVNLRNDVLFRFMTSTNFVEVDGDPEQLQVFGIYDPYKTPCLNQLSSHAV